MIHFMDKKQAAKAEQKDLNERKKTQRILKERIINKLVRLNSKIKRNKFNMDDLTIIDTSLDEALEGWLE